MVLLSKWGPYLFPPIEEAIQNFIDDFFYSFPESVKPPAASKLVYSSTPGDPNATVTAFEIQMAVAGFGKEDIEVCHDDRVLTIRGSNEKKGIADKLSCSFERRYAVSEKMDLSKIKVKLDNGLLTVHIPVKVEENRSVKKVFIE